MINFSFFLPALAQDLKLVGGLAGKHKVSSDGIRSTKALIQHFSPGQVSESAVTQNSLNS